MTTSVAPARHAANTLPRRWEWGAGDSHARLVTQGERPEFSSSAENNATALVAGDRQASLNLLQGDPPTCAASTSG